MVLAPMSTGICASARSLDARHWKKIPHGAQAEVAAEEVAADVALGG